MQLSKSTRGIVWTLGEAHVVAFSARAAELSIRLKISGWTRPEPETTSLHTNQTEFLSPNQK